MLKAAPFSGKRLLYFSPLTGFKTLSGVEVDIRYSSCAASNTSKIFFPAAATLVPRPKMATTPASYRYYGGNICIRYFYTFDFKSDRLWNSKQISN
jgi:hypothetical protein